MSQVAVELADPQQAKDAIAEVRKGTSNWYVPTAEWWLHLVAECVVRFR